MEFQEAYEYLCDALIQLETVLGSDPDTPTYQSTIDAAETALSNIKRRLKEADLLPPELEE